MSKAKFIATTKVTSKFQISLPVKVREKLQAQSGDTLFYLEVDGKIQLVKDVEFKTT